jgi:hypothetical protein
MLAEYFYLDAEGQAQGPYTAAQLVALETLGYVFPETLVATGGSSEWQRLGEVTARLRPELGDWYRERLQLPKEKEKAVPSPTPGSSSSAKKALSAEADLAVIAAAAAAAQGGKSRWMPALAGMQTLLILLLLALLVPLITRVTKMGRSVDIMAETLPGETARANASATRQVFGEFENSLMAKLARGQGQAAGVPSPTPATGAAAGKKSEVPAFLLKRTSAREVKLEDYLAQLEVEGEGALRLSQPAAWRELELLTSSNVFRGLTQKARESFLAERVAVFREWPDLRFEHSPLSQELVKFLKTLSEKESQTLFTPGGLKVVVHRLAAEKRAVRIVREFQDDPLKLPDWEGINAASRDRAWSMYPDSRDLGSALMGRIDEIHRRLEREKHALLANPYYPWIVTEMAADSMGVRAVDPYPAPLSAELRAAEKGLKAMGDPAEIARDMTAFELHPEGAAPMPVPSPTPAPEPAPTVAPEVSKTNPLIEFAPASPEIKASGEADADPGVAATGQ